MNFKIAIDASVGMEHGIKIVNKNQKEQMILGIFLFNRRRKQIVLRVIVDHGLGQNLVICVALG